MTNSKEAVGQIDLETNQGAAKMCIDKRATIRAALMLSVGLLIGYLGGRLMASDRSGQCEETLARLRDKRNEADFNSATPWLYLTATKSLNPEIHAQLDTENDAFCALRRMRGECVFDNCTAQLSYIGGAYVAHEKECGDHRRTSANEGGLGFSHDELFCSTPMAMHIAADDWNVCPNQGGSCTGCHHNCNVPYQSFDTPPNSFACLPISYEGHANDEVTVSGQCPNGDEDDPVTVYMWDDINNSGGKNNPISLGLDCSCTPRPWPGPSSHDFSTRTCCTGTNGQMLSGFKKKCYSDYCVDDDDW